MIRRNDLLFAVGLGLFVAVGVGAAFYWLRPRYNYWSYDQADSRVRVELQVEITWPAEITWPDASPTHSAISEIAFSGDGRRLAVLSWDGKARVWDVSSGELLFAKSAGYREATMAISPDGRLLAHASYRQHHNTTWGGSFIWDIDESTILAHLGIAASGSMAFSPNGDVLAVEDGWGRDGVSLFDVSTWKKSGFIGQYTNRMTFSPDGRSLALTAWVNRQPVLRLWEFGEHREPVYLKGHTDQVTSAAFSPDGTIVATASLDKTVKLWDAVHQRELTTLQHHHRVRSVSFSADQQFLATSTGGRATIWDARKRQRVATLRSADAAVSVVTFSPVDAILVVARYRRPSYKGGDPAPLQLWRVIERGGQHREEIR